MRYVNATPINLGCVRSLPRRASRPPSRVAFTHSAHRIRYANRRTTPSPQGVCVQRENLIPGDVYLHSNNFPFLLVTNRLYMRTGKGENPKRVTYSHVPPGITSARGAHSYKGEWVDYGYLTVRPTQKNPELDYEVEMRPFPAHRMLDEMGLPALAEIPKNYELYFVTSLQRV